VGEANYILGLDVGTKKIAALLGHSRGSQLTLCAVGLAPSEGLRRGEVIDLEKATGCISRALANLHLPTRLESFGFKAAGEVAPVAEGTQRQAAAGSQPGASFNPQISPPRFPPGKAFKASAFGRPVLPRRVWIGISGDHIRCFNPRAAVSVHRPGRAITPRDVEQAMREAVKSVSLPAGHEVVHVIARSFAIEDFSRPEEALKAEKEAPPSLSAGGFRNNIANPVGMCASRLEVQAHVITASSAALAHLEHCVEQAGLSVEGIVLEPLASGDAVLSEAERDLGVALLDLGAGTTDIAIFVAGSVCFSGSLALGGNHITRDLAVGLEIDLEEAENLKISSGCALIDMVGQEERVNLRPLSAASAQQAPRRLLAEIIQPRAAEILSLAKEQMVRSGFFHRLAVGAVLTGGASQLEGLLPLAKQVLGLPVRLGRPFGFAWDGHFGRGGANLKDPALATGIGLLIYGCHEQVPSPAGAWPQVRSSLPVRLLGWWKHLFGP